MRSAAFQKLSVVAVSAVALLLGPVAVGSAAAEEPGWQTEPSKVGEVIPAPSGEPGWQSLAVDPGWQRIAELTQ
ncbi:hypothetical protein ACFC3O_19905 [Streptomyces sp. NPDC056007]|uniref:hypothetical protein n=1 Tax=Streptomyces sp. NPDC056007 TaxID=3345678 RepID=UPI0017F1AF61|nr:hypothetical protein [Streptomyces sp. SJ1-7]